MPTWIECFVSHHLLLTFPWPFFPRSISTLHFITMEWVLCDKTKNIKKKTAVLFSHSFSQQNLSKSLEISMLLMMLLFLCVFFLWFFFARTRTHHIKINGHKKTYNQMATNKNERTILNESECNEKQRNKIIKKGNVFFSRFDLICFWHTFWESSEKNSAGFDGERMVSLLWFD